MKDDMHRIYTLGKKYLKDSFYLLFYLFFKNILLFLCLKKF